MSTHAFAVAGMTCGHCASAVSEEISAIDEVAAVSVDVPSGIVTVDAGDALDESRVAAAVTEAGYELVGRA